MDATVDLLVQSIFDNRLEPVQDVVAVIGNDCLTEPLFKALTNHVIMLAEQNTKHALQLAEMQVELSQLTHDQKLTILALWGKGWALSKRHRLTEALACYQTVAEYYASQEEWRRLAGAQINQIPILQHLGRLQDAITLSESARQNCARSTKSAKSYLVNLELNIASVYLERGDYDKMLASVQRGLALAKVVNNQYAVAAFTLQMGRAYREIGRFHEATTYFEQAIEQYHQLNMLAEVARTQLNYGQLLRQANRFQEGLHQLESARIGFTELEESVEVAYVDLERSHIYLQCNLLDEALRYASEAECIFKRQRMPLYRAEAFFNLANAQWRNGNLQSAEKIFARTRRIVQAVGAQSVLNTLDVQRAQLAVDRGQLTTARRIAQRLATTLQSTDQPVLFAEVQLVLAQCRPNSAAHLARAKQLAEQYHLPEINITARHLAGQADPQLITLVEQQCQLFGIDELRIGYLSNKSDLFAASIKQQLNRPQINALIEMLERVQRLPLPTAGARGQAGQKDPQLEMLRNEWHWYQAKLQTSVVAPHAQALDYDRLYAIEQEIAERLRRKRIHQAGATTGVISAEIDNLADTLQSALQPNEALINYFIVDDACHAVAISAETVTCQRNIAQLADINAALDAWRFFIRHIMPSQPHLPPSMAQMYLADLYELLWEPLLPQVGHADHVGVVLPTTWHDLPMCALFDGDRYLIEAVRVAHLPTLSSFLRENSAEPYTRNVTQHALVLANTDNNRLPHTLAEAQKIVETMRPQWQTAYFAESDATVATFREQAQNASVIHCATHASFRADNPLFSSFQLADGYVTVTDLYDIHLLQRPLVVLSACETGRGDPRGGGLLGMGRGFLVAGASALILSRWQLEDESAATLMHHFYTLWDGQRGTVAQTLHEAQLATLQHHPHPFAWAAYLCLEAS